MGHAVNPMPVGVWFIYTQSDFNVAENIVPFVTKLLKKINKTDYLETLFLFNIFIYNKLSFINSKYISILTMY